MNSKLSEQTNPVWEYRELYRTPNAGAEQLQELGDQGFELIHEDRFGRLTFKRRKPQAITKSHTNAAHTSSADCLET